MNDTTRDLLYRLGSELARIMEDASTEAALLPGVPAHTLSEAVDRLERAANEAQALVKAMQVLLPGAGEDQQNFT